MDSRFISIATGPGPALVWLLNMATRVGAAEPVLAFEAADSSRSNFAARRSRREGRSRGLREGESGGCWGADLEVGAIEAAVEPAVGWSGMVGAVGAGVVGVGGAESAVAAAFPRVRRPPPRPRSRWSIAATPETWPRLRSRPLLFSTSLPASSDLAGAEAGLLGVFGTADDDKDATLDDP